SEIDTLPLVEISEADNRMAVDRDLNYAIVSMTFIGKEFQDDLEQRRRKNVQLRDSWFSPVLALFKPEMEGISELRHACEVLCRAHESWEPSGSIFLSMMCVEGLLLSSTDTRDVGRRLRETVAGLLSANPTERRYYRDLVKILYRVRSKYVHQGSR